MFDLSRQNVCADASFVTKRTNEITAKVNVWRDAILKTFKKAHELIK